MRNVLQLLTVLSLIGCASDDDRWRAVETHSKARAAALGSDVCIAIAWVKHEETRTHFAGRPDCNQNSLFAIGSITKVFTGIALTDAIRRDLVEYNAPVSQYLDDVTIPEFEGQPIYFSHLAQHTSGLPRSWESDLSDADHPAGGDDQFTEYLASVRLKWAPGERHLYSNVGYGLLGWVLARVNGVDYESMIRSRVMRPAGMRESAVWLNDSQRQNLIGKPFNVERTDVDAGNGALYSSVADLTAFARSLLESRESDPGGLFDQYADAWPNRTIDHGGAILAPEYGASYRAYFVANASESEAAVVLMNAFDSDPSEIAHYLMGWSALVHDELMPEVTDDDYLGRYEFTDGPLDVIVISERDGALFFKGSGLGVEIPVNELGPDRLFVEALDGEMVFLRNEDSIVTHVDLVEPGGGGESIRGIKVY